MYFIFHITVKKVSSLWLIINLSLCIMALSFKKRKEKGMACFSMLFPWLVGFGNEHPKWTFAIYILSCLHLSIVQNISKAFLDQTIMPFKYVGQHVPYLLALCQMNCIIPIWCHMCMEARSACNRCCRNALDRDIDSKVICENEYPKYQLEGYLSTARVLQHQKGAVLFSFFFPGVNQGKKCFGNKV